MLKLLLLRTKRRCRGSLHLSRGPKNPAYGKFHIKMYKEGSFYDEKNYDGETKNEGGDDYLFHAVPVSVYVRHKDKCNGCSKSEI